MKIKVNVEASMNEKRRFIGQADITPMVELLSEILDSLMFAVVQMRRAELEADGYGAALSDGEESDEMDVTEAEHDKDVSDARVMRRASG